MLIAMTDPMFKVVRNEHLHTFNSTDMSNTASFGGHFVFRRFSSFRPFTLEPSKQNDDHGTGRPQRMHKKYAQIVEKRFPV